MKDQLSSNREDMISGKAKANNVQHREARARVEAPNGEIKNKFKALNEA